MNICIMVQAAEGCGGREAEYGKQNRMYQGVDDLPLRSNGSGDFRMRDKERGNFGDGGGF